MEKERITIPSNYASVCERMYDPIVSSAPVRYGTLIDRRWGREWEKKDLNMMTKKFIHYYIGYILIDQ